MDRCKSLSTFISANPSTSANDEKSNKSGTKTNRANRQLKRENTCSNAHAHTAARAQTVHVSEAGNMTSSLRRSSSISLLEREETLNICFHAVVKIAFKSEMPKIPKQQQITARS